MTATVDFAHAAEILRQYNAAYLARHGDDREVDS